jgi:hypothetical protein
MAPVAAAAGATFDALLDLSGCARSDVVVVSFRGAISGSEMALSPWPIPVPATTPVAGATFESLADFSRYARSDVAEGSLDGNIFESVEATWSGDPTSVPASTSVRGAAFESKVLPVPSSLRDPRAGATALPGDGSCDEVVVPAVADPSAAPVVVSFRAPEPGCDVT